MADHRPPASTRSSRRTPFGLGSRCVRGAWLGAWALVGTVACRSADPAGTQASATASHSAVDAIPPPVGAPPLLDPSAHDELALRRIAESQRAPALLAIAESARPERAVALAALAYADDVELVLGRLSELALDRARKDRRVVLEVLRAVAYRRPPRTERLAPESVRTCGKNLRALAADSTDDEALRSLAETAANALERSGMLSPTPSAVSSAAASAAPSSR